MEQLRQYIVNQMNTSQADTEMQFQQDFQKQNFKEMNHFQEMLHRQDTFLSDSKVDHDSKESK